MGDSKISRLPKLPSIFSFPFFFNPVWVLCLLVEVFRFRPDRLLVRDLPLAPLAVLVGRLTSIQVIADLAGPYPDSLRSQWRFQPMSAFDRIVRNPTLADHMERFVLR